MEIVENYLGIKNHIKTKYGLDIVITQSGKYFEVDEPFVCMITEDVTEEGRQILMDSGYSDLPIVDKIIPQRTDGIKDRYKDNSWMMYTKLNLWSLTQY